MAIEIIDRGNVNISETQLDATVQQYGFCPDMDQNEAGTK